MPRIAALLALALLALTSVPLLAAASHGPHAPCATSTFSVGNSVRVDVWADNQCAGATVYSPLVACALGPHVDLLGVHVMVLHSSGCETGAIAELP